MSPGSKGKSNKPYPVSMPYLGSISERIARILKKIGVETSFRSSGSLADRLSKTKDKVDTLDRSGVYRVSCVSCPSSYVGQSGRKLRTRVKEHLTRKDSMVKKHAMQEGHDLSAVDFEVLHYANKGKKMDYLERLEISLDMESSRGNINKKGENIVLRHVPPSCIPSIARIKSQSAAGKARIRLEQL